MEKKFSKEAVFEGNDKWSSSIMRIDDIYRREDDIRSEFTRDYNRILHSRAYGRLKHKTQVFFNTHNDHICTRIEHVDQVAAVSYSIANYLGLNTELTNAIALGHDIGHAPFGHEGESILKKYIFKNNITFDFWHEKNSLYFIDSIETLPDIKNNERNLNLTYAVRDGVICHCGEINQKSIFPRKDLLDLKDINKPGDVQPYTWEGCVVKIADKIAYLGRDIEDAIELKILTMSQLKELIRMAQSILGSSKEKSINNTVLMYAFMTDLCRNSSIEKGICLSENYLELMDMVKDYNYKYIYNNVRVESFKKYAKLILKTIINTLESIYDGNGTIERLDGIKEIYPLLYSTFYEWLIKYTKNYESLPQAKKYKNNKIYDLAIERDYYRAIIDYVSGMTDSFAIRVFDEIMEL